MTATLTAGPPARALDALSGPLAGVLIGVALALVVAMATAVVLTRDPARQAIVLSGYGLVLGLLFLVLQAPDVAMSQLAVGTVLVPLIVVLALHAARRHRDAAADRAARDDHDDRGGRGSGGREARR
ncbi:hydrogenase subunit MbhD domain-containing protein [Actinomadura chibensis]|uniref:DUF4040 domain-containing protein n=1 Tax=Actinomadura chibensis TaxID=392828 RepID=A0A5D0NAG3_9ACTN|nr:hydrogenase subunit MbhD domain-containing protein [Actinomadura chibensis]TYB41316.1 DUF4040 domain-containing protein [Actinomadura chibensis]